MGTTAGDAREVTMLGLIEGIGKIVSVAAILLFLSGLTLNFGYFSHIGALYNFIGVSDAFSSLFGVLDVIRAGLFWVYLVPAFIAGLLALFYFARLGDRWRIVTGIAFVIFGIALGLVANEVLRSDRLMHQTVTVCCILILFSGFPLTLPEVPRDHFKVYSVILILFVWFTACYLNGTVWFINDAEVSRSNQIYVQTDDNKCLSRRIMRNLDAGFLVFEEKHRYLELFPKTKVRFLTLAPNCDLSPG
jgi:hypothetical protein